MSTIASTQARRAVVTGATRGIGRRIVEQLAATGWDLVVSARDVDALAALRDELADSHGATVVAHSADLVDEASLLDLAAVAGTGRLDALILNGGMGAIGPFAEFPARRFDRLYTVNARSAFVLIQSLLPALRETAASSPFGAKVVAVSSMTGLAGEALNAAYGASKAALISLCETLNTEESLAGVSATAVCPGYVATDMTANLPGAAPADQMIDADDVAEVVTAMLRLSRRSLVPQVAISRPGTAVWRA